MRDRWLIVADDLTGAADAGVAFARRGCAAEVTWSANAPPLNVVVHAHDLDSRGCDTAEAAARHLGAVRQWLGPERALYKKIDSTLRGQPAAEIAALCAGLRELGRPAWGIFAPANPAMGRTTREGRVFVRGQPLEQTETWQREHNYDNADLAAILATAGLHAIKLPLAALRDDPRACETAFRAAAAANHAAGSILICDAETDADLARIVAAARETAEPGLYIGTAGLANALAAHTPSLGARAVNLAPTKRGTLVAVGSPAKVSRDAASRLATQLGIQPVRIEPVGVYDGPAQALFAMSIGARMMRGEVTIALLEAPLPQDGALDPRYARFFAETLTHALKQMGGLIVTGGETARALLEQARIRGITLLDEIEPGLALGLTRGDVEVPIVTKPGAFGDEESLVRCLARMRQLQASK